MLVISFASPRQHLATTFDECNCNLQCKYCNKFEQGADAKYRVAIDKKWGAGGYCYICNINTGVAGMKQNLNELAFEIHKTAIDAVKEFLEHFDY